MSTSGSRRTPGQQVPADTGAFVKDTGNVVHYGPVAGANRAEPLLTLVVGGPAVLGGAASSRRSSPLGAGRHEIYVYPRHRCSLERRPHRPVAHRREGAARLGLSPFGFRGWPAPAGGIEIRRRGRVRKPGVSATGVEQYLDRALSRPEAIVGVVWGSGTTPTSGSPERSTPYHRDERCSLPGPRDQPARRQRPPRRTTPAPGRNAPRWEAPAMRWEAPP